MRSDVPTVSPNISVSDLVYDHLMGTDEHGFPVMVGDRLEFPGATVATVLVYRVFPDTSMALVLKSSDAIRLNDRVVTP